MKESVKFIDYEGENIKVVVTLSDFDVFISVAIDDQHWTWRAIPITLIEDINRIVKSAKDYVDSKFIDTENTLLSHGFKLKEV